MKKLISLFLVLALLLTPGCGSIREEPGTAVQTQVPAAAEPDLLDGSTPAGDFLSVSNPALEGLRRITGLYAAGDSLLICGGSSSWAESETSELTDFQLRLLDAGSGALRASAEFMLPDLGQVQLLTDGFGVTESISGRVILLDDRLQTVSTYEVPDSDTGLYLSTDGRYAYTFPQTGGVCRRDLGAGTDTVLLSDMIHTFISACHGDDLTLTCLSRTDDRYHHLRLPMSGGDIEELPFDRGMISAEYGDGVWFGPDPGEENRYLIGNGPDPVCAALPAFSVVDLVSGPAPLFLTDYDEAGNTVVSFYTLEGNAFSAGAVPSQWMLLSEPVWSAARGGYFFLGMTQEEEYRVLFLKAKPGQGTIPVTRLSQMAAENPLPEALLHRAEEMSRRYGVRLLLGSDCKTQFQNFEARPELDPEIISGALDQLETAFSAYPPGFMAQLAYGYYRQPEIHLTGTLTDRDVPADANGYTSFAAFVSHDTEGLYMVLDITLTGLEQTVYHEMSHLIDGKLEFHASNQESIYSEEAWAALNPPDFQYAESLYDIPERFYSDRYNGFFIDIYARTFPTEDRARVMEYAMLGGPDFFSGEFYLPLREKLQFYADAIRDGFDTTGWPEITRWEEPLF